MKRWLNIGIIVLGLPVLAGCSRAQQGEVRQGAQGVGQQIESAAANVTLATKVKTALATRKGLDGAKIDVDATGPVVTLKGDVVTREQADLAERVARETDGVQSVSNELMLRVPAKGPTVAVPGRRPRRMKPPNRAAARQRSESPRRARQVDELVALHGSGPGPSPRGWPRWACPIFSAPFPPTVAHRAS